MFVVLLYFSKFSLILLSNDIIINDSSIIIIIIINDSSIIIIILINGSSIIIIVIIINDNIIIVILINDNIIIVILIFELFGLLRRPIWQKSRRGEELAPPPANLPTCSRAASCSLRSRPPYFVYYYLFYY